MSTRRLTAVCRRGHRLASVVDDTVTYWLPAGSEAAPEPYPGHLLLERGQGGSRQRFDVSLSATPGWVLPALLVGCGCMRFLLPRFWLDDELARATSRWVVTPTTADLAYDDGLHMLNLQREYLEALAVGDRPCLERLRRLLEAGPDRDTPHGTPA